MMNFRDIEKKFQNLLNLPDKMYQWTGDISELIQSVNRRKVERNFVLVLIQGFVVDTIYGEPGKEKTQDDSFGFHSHDKEVITSKPVSMAMSGFLPHRFEMQPDIKVANMQIGIICDLSKVRIESILIANQNLSPHAEGSPFAYFNGICAIWNKIAVEVSER